MKFNEFNEGMKLYFDTLPKYMQQNIIHSDVDFESLEELKAYSKNIENEQEDRINAVYTELMVY